MTHAEAVFYTLRSNAYHRWCETKDVKAFAYFVPRIYYFLDAHPERYPEALVAFNLHWAVLRLTGKTP